MFLKNIVKPLRYEEKLCVLSNNPRSKKGLEG